MMAPAPEMPSDPGLPGARGLFGSEGMRVVSGFLGDRGWAVEEARPVQAMYRPGRSLVVRYRVAAGQAGRRRAFSICAEVRRRPRKIRSVPDGFGERHGIPDPVDRRGGPLVWVFPYDPALDGIEDAATPATITEAIGTAGARPAAVSVEAVRYRPGRRAVFRYRSLHRDRRGRRWETSYGKVVPSDKARRIEAAGGVLRAIGRRIPLSLPAGRLGRDGLLFPSLRGRSLRQLLVSGSSLPSPTRIAALPGAVVAAAETADLEPLAPRPTPGALAGPAADLVFRLVPDVSPAAERVRAEIERLAGDAVPSSIVHGDLYEAQILVGDGFELGLIDLDDVGRGDPVLDAANFCAHLLALALAVPSASDRLVAYRRLVRSAFTTALDVPPHALAWREALCMLLLAAGPFRVLDPAWPAEIRRRAALAVRLLEET
jgi:hypothetical protein